MIPVTKPFLPPKEDYEKYLKGIWHRRWLTNMGPLASELEMKLKDHLCIDHLLFVTNGTVALQMAIKALDLKGEIITTPFSFIATTSSIVWEGCTPIFADIDKDTLNIDVKKIEEVITERTTAILATHVYGNPCDVLGIQKIADKYNLKVIYDGAHAFGVKVEGKSVFEYGDITTCSLHATKLYHSVEGGLMITQNAAVLKKLAYIRNFGFNGPEAFAELGLNGKNSEFHAAMGLANLDHIESIHTNRKLICEHYDKKLKNFKGVKPVWNSFATMNYAYYPIVVEDESLLYKCIEILKLNEIFIRRYFYPSLSTVLPYVESVEMPITEDIARRVMCLPLYHDLSLEEVDLICRLLLRTQNN
ncbi:DegT/DnrJ/EryC1/StrS family aminotransferase [Pedobacter africanus]|uniref:dTDP-4-amino-4,6-dideoxygalactose transaminase n=1 Tax=Pedobacter africanus TaxID=151894 RepID=A0A1W2BSY6_9SPHI|nr:DegT/DnrJ/EryC1/StrS family aminotransferase [Pedobacter africanus]SMC75846.1 dTDP-4-amino-4,6-dideoxygalactose transaminase [Pedobacter africanus]